MNRETQNCSSFPLERSTDILQQHSINSLLMMGVTGRAEETEEVACSTPFNNYNSSSANSSTSTRSMFDFPPVENDLFQFNQTTPSLFEQRDLFSSPGTPRSQVGNNNYQTFNSPDFNRFMSDAMNMQSTPKRRPENIEGSEQELHLTMKCVPIGASSVSSSRYPFQIQASVPNGLRNGSSNGFSPEFNMLQTPFAYEHEKMLKWEGRTDEFTDGGFSRFSPGAFSAKVFLGGLPWRITEKDLNDAFSCYGPLTVEWPDKKENAGCMNARTPRGYAYLRFENETSVKRLLARCGRDQNENYYHAVYQAGYAQRTKNVQVIPWNTTMAVWSRTLYAKLKPAQTVFVGGLHGVIGAALLAKVFTDLFGEVIYTGIDTDKNKYPIGSGRVTFTHRESYLRAIKASYVEVKTQRFIKKVQIEPYLEQNNCDKCIIRQGTYFCRSPECLTYFCHTCWDWDHKGRGGDHKKVMRTSNSRGYQTVTVTANAPPRSASPSASPFSSTSSQNAPWFVNDF